MEGVETFQYNYPLSFFLSNPSSGSQVPRRRIDRRMDRHDEAVARFFKARSQSCEKRLSMSIRQFVQPYCSIEGDLTCRVATDTFRDLCASPNTPFSFKVCSLSHLDYCAPSITSFLPALTQKRVSTFCTKPICPAVYNPGYPE